MDDKSINIPEPAKESDFDALDIERDEQERSRAELEKILVLDTDFHEAEEKQEGKKREARLDIYDWIQSIVSTLVIVIIAFIMIGRQIGVDGISMRDTLHNNDSVFVTTLFYTPSYGDIVIIKVDAYGETPLVKRVIATEGQTIDINFETSEVIVDGAVLDEPYIREPTRAREDFAGEVTVPKGCIFVMGDNRNASKDSRDMQVGLIDVRDVIGKVHFVLIPGEDKQANSPRDWSRIGSVYKTLP